MSYYLTDPYFYLPKSYPYHDSSSKVCGSAAFYDNRPSNRLTERTRLIEEQSINRRLKVAAQINKSHRAQSINSLRIKYKLQQLEGNEYEQLNKQNKKVRRTQLSRQLQYKKSINNEIFAQIMGCRHNKVNNTRVKGHEFPQFIGGQRK